jgi:phosphoglycolate phosphatase
VKTLIFDFDGTIADSFETLLAIFDETTARPHRLTASEIAELRGEPLKDVIKYLKIKRWQMPRLILRAKRLLALRMSGIKAFAGISEALARLHHDGYQMFILSTNSSVNISGFLKSNGLESYFTSVYGDIGLRSKASALKKIIKKEKLSPADCIYIGDEVRDIEAAKKAGIRSVAVSWGFSSPPAIQQAQPSYMANNPKDLIKHLTD